MGNRGPSPLVPSLIVGVLGLMIFSPFLLTLADYLLPLFQASDSEANGRIVIVLVLLLLLFLVHFLSAVIPILRFPSTCPTQQTTSADADGFGLGSLLLLLLFLILYSFVWQSHPSNSYKYKIMKCLPTFLPYVFVKIYQKARLFLF